MKKIILILTGAFLLSACVKNNPDPSWLEISAWTLEENPDSQYPTGQLTQNFSDAWVFVDDQTIGVFELPVKIPLLVSGDVEIKVFPAILNNGISATKKIYPFTEPYILETTLTQNGTTSINPVTKYANTVRFWIEDFEDAGFSIENDVTAQAQIQISNDANIIQSFNDARFGRISLNSTDSLWAGFTEDVLLPTSSEVYLEMDYHNTNSLLTGVLGISSSGVTENPNVQLNPQDASEVVWKKIYIDLTEIITNLPDAEHFKISFQSILDDNISTGEVNIDNVKLVHY